MPLFGGRALILPFLGWWKANAEKRKP